MGGSTAPETVGRHGELLLAYGAAGGRTALSRARCRSPWHFFPPIELDGGACAYTLLVNPSGGLVGGDRLSVSAEVGPGAHVLFSTPSANRIYRTMGQSAEQTIELHVGPDAVLEWLPDPTIPFAGSRYRQRISVHLDPGARMIFWDVVAAGRIACDERWRFSEMDSEIRIDLAGKGTVLERYRIGTEVGGVGLAEPWNYLASVFVVGDDLDQSRCRLLADRCVGIADGLPGVMAGVSEPSIPGVAMKLLARDVMTLRMVLDGVWGAARAELVNRSAPPLRRY